MFRAAGLCRCALQSNGEHYCWVLEVCEVLGSGN